LVGLNLMRLLSQNRIAEFHSELELLQKVGSHVAEIHFVQPVETSP